MSAFFFSLQNKLFISGSSQIMSAKNEERVQTLSPPLLFNVSTSHSPPPPFVHQCQQLPPTPFRTISLVSIWRISPRAGIDSYVIEFFFFCSEAYKFVDLFQNCFNFLCVSIDTPLRSWSVFFTSFTC